jgi:hypothetical protein
MWNKKSIVQLKIGLKHTDFELYVYYQINSDYTIIMRAYGDNMLILSKHKKRKEELRSWCKSSRWKILVRQDIV